MRFTLQRRKNPFGQDERFEDSSQSSDEIGKRINNEELTVFEKMDWKMKVGQKKEEKKQKDLFRTFFCHVCNRPMKEESYDECNEKESIHTSKQKWGMENEIPGENGNHLTQNENNVEEVKAVEKKPEEFSNPELEDIVNPQILIPTCNYCNRHTCHNCYNKCIYCDISICNNCAQIKY